MGLQKLKNLNFQIFSLKKTKQKKLIKKENLTSNRTLMLTIKTSICLVLLLISSINCDYETSDTDKKLGNHLKEFVKISHTQLLQNAQTMEDSLNDLVVLARGISHSTMLDLSEEDRSTTEFANIFNINLVDTAEDQQTLELFENLETKKEKNVNKIYDSLVTLTSISNKGKLESMRAHMVSAAAIASVLQGNAKDIYNISTQTVRTASCIALGEFSECPESNNQQYGLDAKRMLNGDYQDII